MILKINLKISIQNDSKSIWDVIQEIVSFLQVVKRI